MPIDAKYLREHYASLSDEALLNIDRADLVETAQNCYYDELARRRAARHENAEFDSEPLSDRDRPDWLKDASEVLSETRLHGSLPAGSLLAAQNALEAEGIQCYLTKSEVPKPDPATTRVPTHEWRLMVPGNLNQRATSVLDRDLFNADFEEDWRVQLDMLSDEELREMKPQVVFCGLFDRIERVTRTYDAEIARRKL
jgi:hypothetical protein